jgi:HEAT repeat protein
MNSEEPVPLLFFGPADHPWLAVPDNRTLILRASHFAPRALPVAIEMICEREGVARATGVALMELLGGIALHLLTEARDTVEESNFDQSGLADVLQVDKDRVAPLLCDLGLLTHDPARGRTFSSADQATPRSWVLLERDFEAPTLQAQLAGRHLAMRTSPLSFVARHWDDSVFDSVWPTFFSVASRELALQAFGHVLDDAAPLDRHLHRPRRFIIRHMGSGPIPFDCMPAWQEVEAWAVRTLARGGLAALNVLNDLSDWARPLSSGLRPAVLGALDAPHAAIRRSAVSALKAQVNDDEIRQAVTHRLDDDDPEVQKEAADSLASRWCDAGVQPHLERALFSKNSGVREHAACALAPSLGDANARKRLLPHFYDDFERGDPDYRAGLVLAHRTGDAELRRVLCHLTTADEESLRVFATAALCRDHWDSSVRSLFLKLTEHPGRSIRRALGGFAFRQTMRMNPSAPFLISRPVREIGRLNAALARVSIWGWRQIGRSPSDRHRSRREAIKLLGHSYDAAASVVLAALVADQDLYIRNEAAGTLAVWGHTELGRQVAMALPLESAQFLYSGHPASALAHHVGHQAVVQRLIGIAKSADSADARLAAVGALGRCAERPEVRKVLIEIASDGTWQALSALVGGWRYWYFDDGTRQRELASNVEVSNVLVAALKHVHERTRAAAVNALSLSADDENVCRNLIPLLDDPDGLVVNQVLGALRPVATKPMVRDRLLRFLQLGRRDHRPAAIAALESQFLSGDVQALILASLNDDYIDDESAIALSAGGGNPEMVRRAIEQLGSEDLSRQFNAQQALLTVERLRKFGGSHPLRYERPRHPR